VVVIRHRKEHKAIETGYYETTDTEKQHRSLYLFPRKLIFEALKSAQGLWKIQRAQNKAKIYPGSVLCYVEIFSLFNLLKPNDIYMCRTEALTSRRYILNIYSTNIHTEYFKHAA